MVRAIQNHQPLRFRPGEVLAGRSSSSSPSSGEMSNSGAPRSLQRFLRSRPRRAPAGSQHYSGNLVARCRFCFPYHQCVTSRMLAVRAMCWLIRAAEGWCLGRIPVFPSGVYKSSHEPRAGVSEGLRLLRRKTNRQDERAHITSLAYRTNRRP
jgi:hypothetical protein